MVDEILKIMEEDFQVENAGAVMDDRGIVTLRGACGSWQTLIDVGHRIAKMPGVRNVVSDMQAKGVEIPRRDYGIYAEKGKQIGLLDTVDVVIIGAGVSGCGIARELSRYALKIIVAEMGNDVANAASKANNGDIHAGHAVAPGTLKAKLNVKGNQMYTRWAEELNFHLDRCGSLRATTEEKLVPGIRQMYETALINGVDGARLVSQEEAVELDPKFGVELERLGKKAAAILWLPSMGAVEPYEVVVALAENAARNGVKFLLNCTVAEILHRDGQVEGVVTEQGIIKAKYVINCAGVYADEMSELAGDRSYTIHPRKGTIAILDKACPPLFKVMGGISTREETVKKNVESKGGGMCLTPEHNILLGPSATEVPDKEDVDTTPEDLAYAMSRNSNPYAGYGNIIRIFAGTRPADFKEDFIIEMSGKTHGFINVGGIQSPGLASAPAVARMAVGILREDMEKNGSTIKERPDYNPIEPPRIAFRHMSHGEQDALIRKDPRYGKIICRCEQVTEGEILDAVHSMVVPTSIDAIKRRTRAGMGRCQGGFCQPRVLELLARELGKDWVDITLKGEGSNVLAQPNRGETKGGPSDERAVL